MARGSNKQAIESTAEPAVEPAGDGGAREEAVSQAQEQFNQLHERIDLGDEAGLVVRNATDWVIEMFKHRPKPWDQLSQAEQRDLAAGIEENVHELVRHVVEAISRTGRDAVRCLFVGFTDKGDDIKAELKVKAFSKEETESAVISMHRARGKHVLVTVASADDFHDQRGADRSEPDQRSLGFEAGTDEHPEDNGDLADAGGEEIVEVEPQVLKTGDELHFANAYGTVRINLIKGWVQFNDSEDPDADANWQDMREATPAELAAERERTADFDVTETEPETEQVD